MNREVFDPSDPKYQNVSDLPEEQQPRFTDLPDGGFVRAEAFKELEDAEVTASNKNNRRPLFDKLTNKNKLSAVDVIQEEATYQELKRPDSEKYLVEKLFQGFELLFEDPVKGREFIEIIKDKKIDTILSEDSGGRLPAEAIQRALNTIYGEKSNVHVTLESFPFGRSSTEESAYTYSKELLENHKLGKGVLVVSELIYSGKSHRKSYGALHKTVHEAWQNKQQVPKFYGFFALGEDYRKGIPEVDLYPGLNFGFVARPNDTLAFGDWSYYGGLERNSDSEVVPNEDLKNMPHILKAREEIIQQAANKIVELYNSATRNN